MLDMKRSIAAAAEPRVNCLPLTDHNFKSGSFTQQFLASFEAHFMLLACVFYNYCSVSSGGGASEGVFLFIAVLSSCVHLTNGQEEVEPGQR